jgi:hypothetical protein
MICKYMNKYMIVSSNLCVDNNDEDRAGKHDTMLVPLHSYQKYGFIQLYYVSDYNQIVYLTNQNHIFSVSVKAPTWCHGFLVWIMGYWGLRLFGIIS